MFHVNESAVESGFGDDLDNRRVSESNVADESQTALTHDLLYPIGFHENLPV